MPTGDGTAPGRRWSAPRILRCSVVIGLLLTSAALALVRVTDPTTVRLIELVTLSPWGLPCAAAAVVGALLWKGSRITRITAGSTATLLMLAHAWWLAPLYVGRAPEAGSGSLVVLAQNFEYGDPDALVDLVRRRDVDVLVVTDVRGARVDLLLDAGIERWLPYDAGLGEDGAVVFSRVPVTGTSLLYEEAESRLVDLRVPVMGAVTVVAFHTYPPYQPDGWRHDHEMAQAALTRLREGADPALVLAGDFNATLAHAPMRRLADLGFTDAAVQVNAGVSPTWPSGGRERRLGVALPAFAAIDHVLTSPRLVVTDMQTVVLEGADHEAVLATISEGGSGMGSGAG